jgi:hypothetical protein
MAGLIMALTRNTDKILEVGCGEALESNFIDRKYLIVSDLTLNRCHSKHKSITFDINSISDAKTIIKKHGKFDFIYEILTLHHSPDMDAGIENLKKIGKTIVFIEPVVWNPQTIVLALLNIKYEPHYLKMTYENLKKILISHFAEVNHITIYEGFYYFFLITPPVLEKIFKPLYILTIMPQYNVFVCR